MIDYSLKSKIFLVYLGFLGNFHFLFFIAAASHICVRSNVVSGLVVYIKLACHIFDLWYRNIFKKMHLR